MKVIVVVIVSLVVVTGVARAGMEFPLPTTDNSCYDNTMNAACCVTDYTGETRCYHKVAVPLAMNEPSNEPGSFAPP